MQIILYVVNHSSWLLIREKSGINLNLKSTIARSWYRKNTAQYIYKAFDIKIIKLENRMPERTFYDFKS